MSDQEMMDLADRTLRKYYPWCNDSGRVNLKEKPAGFEGDLDEFIECIFHNLINALMVAIRSPELIPVLVDYYNRTAISGGRLVKEERDFLRRDGTIIKKTQYAIVFDE